MKLKYFYKYYFNILKLKSLTGNKNICYYKINKDANKIILIKKNNKKTGLKNIIIRDNNKSTEQISYQRNNIFPFNNTHEQFNFCNNSDFQIKYVNKESAFQKKRNKSTNLFNTHNNYLTNIMQDTYKHNNYLNFISNNKIIKRKIINNDSFNFYKNNNKTFTYKNYKNIENNSNNNSNIIIDYINEMEKFNKMIMEQKSVDTKKNSIKKNNSNLCTHKKTKSCINGPLLNKIPNISISINNKDNIFFPFTDNKTGNYNTEENKVMHKNNYYMLNQTNGKYIGKNIIKVYSPNAKEIKTGILRKNISKTNLTKNKLNNSNNLDECKFKIIGINYINKDLVNRINSNSNSKNKKSIYKREKDYYSSNYFKNYSFLSKNLSSSKYDLNSKNSNIKIKISKTNFFSPLLLNRLNNNNFKKITKSNTTNNEVKIDNINKNKNKKIMQYNLLDNYNNYNNYNNSLSTNYKDKQTIKDFNESWTKLYLNNIINKNYKISKTNTSYNHNKKSKNIIFITNNKNSKEKNNNKYLDTKDNRKNSIIKNIDKDISKQNLDKNIINPCLYRIPTSTIKKHKTKILQNIILSNNSSDKPFNNIYNNNNIHSLNKANKNINSAITTTNNFLSLNNKYKNKSKIRINTLLSILKDEKKNNIKNEKNSKIDPYLNISNEKLINKNIKNIDNYKKKEKCLEASFESLSDAKIYELAKTYIQKDECLNIHEMEVLKNKKDVLNK